MNVFQDVVNDLLRGCDIPMLAEVEVRVPVAHHLLTPLRLLLFGSNADCSYQRNVLQYNDSTDIRCVDGVWQRKRTELHVKLPCKVRASLVVSVESPAVAPPLCFVTTTRERWTYNRGAWNIDFTQGERNSNVEIEYVGQISDLTSSLAMLFGSLSDVLASLAFSVFGPGLESNVHSLPFIRINSSKCPVSYFERKKLVRTMQKCQPVSLRATSPAFKCPLLSLKYDGVRLALSVVRYKSAWYIIGTCRRAQAWCVPCLTATTEMTLDCEYVQSTRSFVVFDLLSICGRPPDTDYRGRLRTIAGLPMPVLSCGLTLQCKTVYPMCALTKSWYASQKSECDGIIIHEGTSKLVDSSTLYKWKPVHTVDLYVGPRWSMMDGSYTDFLPLSEGHGQTLQQGQVWECRFEGQGTTVRPLVLRDDKARANARHVCREILQAFKDNLDADDVRVQMTQTSSLRVSKRKRTCISN